ncbi:MULTISPECIES: ScaI family restriction endonuclease [unclassified Synechocystis]|uniref:ScaI family restriction endonuclease n=1 Tax=unclassified Synechocystis TaxID=2640012 RepID=UPI00048BF688|nr:MULTISPECIES: ScaI family restriction endonuclease [unclassified Synechocystis]MCT0255309.1 ScaI family restriction endonuclease [Synechocystis sp. CS-94]
MASPYHDLSVEEWLAKTKDLVNQHPLDFETIRRVALKCWHTLWSTTIGESELSVRLWELDIPATVTGYFFEKLFAKELEKEFPSLWRGSRSKNEKDIVYS